MNSIFWSCSLLRAKLTKKKLLAICMKKKKPRVILRIFVNDVIQTKKVF